jgi:uncharacterized protein (TIGR03492 family)
MTQPRVLFVTNGHGEASIAQRIAEAVHAADPALGIDHFPLVGEGLAGGAMREVGPRRSMPSGGLVAMGNVRAFARDLRAGFAALFFAQLRFLRAAGRGYDAAVAVGDSYALGLALLARVPTVFVGTAKSAYVAPYGPFERTLLRRARTVFVRDERTAADLRAHAVPGARAPGNVIVDLLRSETAALPGEWIGLLPGSREAAYADAVRLARAVRALGARTGAVRALLSVAPTVVAARLAGVLEADGWAIGPRAGEVPFVASAPGAEIHAWAGGLGAFLRAARLVIGQAGTANEAAAACGVPVVALDDGGAAGAGWYRMRQRRLLGEALEIVDAEPEGAAAAVATLLGDAPRLARMRDAGRERMGRPGGAGTIADEVVRVSRGSAAA